MRAVLISLVLAAPAVAAAQPRPAAPIQPFNPATEAQLQAELNTMRAQQNMMLQQQVGLANQLNAADAQSRTQRNLALLHAPTNAQAFAPVSNPGAPLPHIDTSQLASMPDAALAQSNANVRAAANNNP